MFVCIIFAEIILAESPNIGLKVGITYTYKGVTVRFGFDVLTIQYGSRWFRNHKIMALSFKTDFRAEKYHLVNGIHIANDIELDRHIFRYTSVEYLLKLLKSNKLYLGSRRYSEDLNEKGWKLNHQLIGGLCPVLRNKKEQQKIVEETLQKWNAIYASCISCWTYDTTFGSVHTSENYLMWKNYTGKDGIRITSSPNRLANSIQNIGNKDIILSNIKYYTKDTHSLFPQDLIFSKRDFYRDERELRICALNSKDQLLLDINPETMIESITISPFMPSELRKILKIIELSGKHIRGGTKKKKVYLDNKPYFRYQTIINFELSEEKIKELILAKIIKIRFQTETTPIDKIFNKNEFSYVLENSYMSIQRRLHPEWFRDEVREEF